MDKIKHYIVFFFFLFATELSLNAADSSFVSPIGAVSIHTLASDSVSCIIPFNRIGNLMVVKAKADTVEGNFIIDTGAPGLVLNITYFRNYPVTVVPDGEQQSIAGSGGRMSRTSIHELSFGALQYFRTDADLSNLGQIENAKGIRVLGLLGVQLFMNCEMIIDFEKSLIYLHRIGKKESSRYDHQMLKDTGLYRSFSIDITDNRIMTNTELEGKKLKLIIDCAAESSILDSRLPDKIFENVTITRRIKLAGPGDKKIDALYGNLTNMKLGSFEISNLPVTITILRIPVFQELVVWMVFWVLIFFRCIK
jgi:hypothetical protein